jgi:hypothetical protein
MRSIKTVPVEQQFLEKWGQTLIAGKWGQTLIAEQVVTQQFVSDPSFQAWEGGLLAESVYRFKGQSAPAPAVIVTEIDFEQKWGQTLIAEQEVAQQFDSDPTFRARMRQEAEKNGVRP